MKTNKKTLTLQRRSLDQKFKYDVFKNHPQPPGRGWIKAIRESLMMTSTQLAGRMNIAQAAVINMELREAKKTISLDTLERAAAALNCKLVYAIIPIDESLEKTLDKQVFKAAIEIAKLTTHSMSLENQSVQLSETRAQIQDLATELKLKGDRRIWTSDKNKKLK